MNARPARQRPGSTSELRLTANVEPLLTEPSPAARPEPSPPQVESDDEVSAAPQPRERSAETTETKPTQTKPKAASRTSIEKTGPKESFSTRINAELMNKARSAAMHLMVHPDAPRSLGELVENAIEHELARLARQYNDGKPFPPLEGPMRTGRPIGR